jgi:hypothetical protein
MLLDHLLEVDALVRGEHAFMRQQLEALRRDLREGIAECDVIGIAPDVNGGKAKRDLARN